MGWDGEGWDLDGMGFGRDSDGDGDGTRMGWGWDVAGMAMINGWGGEGTRVGAERECGAPLVVVPP